MGYDKLVDSAKLDAALTATANAIRSKTSGTQKIAWDAIKGFADAIASVSKVASGTFTPSYSESNVTISGLGFKPTTVILLALAPHDDSGLEGTCLYAIFDEGSTTSWYAYASIEEEESEDENGNHYIDHVSYMSMYSDGSANIDTNDDGFVVTNAENGWNGELAYDCSYRYYAFALEPDNNDGGGSLIITDDGNGNVVITASGDASITDDGNGNVAITTSGGTSITDDGNGNVVIA